jgi:uncharacterized repeat protein (TIGR03803 family)
VGGLVLSSNTLYGTTYKGGTFDNGTVFSMNTDGTGFRVLHDFPVDTNGSTNTGGANPACDLILSSHTLYGTTYEGGTYGGSYEFGTIFKLNTDGTGFTNLQFTEFTNLQFALKQPSSLVLSGDKLYGTAWGGGAFGNGGVFAINTDGTGFTHLHDFTQMFPPPLPPVFTWINSDGAAPQAGLNLSGTTLYGTASTGGDFGYGTVFAVNTDGTGFTTLYSFSALSGEQTNSDGAAPLASLILSGNTLYGTASEGGIGVGTVFAVNTDGSNFRTVYSFGSTIGGGETPVAGLILSGNTLFGTTEFGGYVGNGTVFKVRTDGSGFEVLHSFTGTTNSFYNGDGASPNDLILSGNTLYGTTYEGGSSAAGTIFSISFTPQLTIIPSGPNAILTWPTNYAGFDYSGHILQSTTNLTSPIWTTNLPAPVLLNGQFTVSNPIWGTQQFFRLSQ